jgi:tungstate transport system ATP-binding protein
MANLLEIHNLSVRRGETVVLQADCLEVREGEVLAIIGPNGAGKSTLLLTLARLLKPSQGEITLRGQPMQSIRDLDYRRRLGLVLQDPLLLDTSVYENVAAGLKFRRMPRAEIERRCAYWLEQMGVPHLKNRSARQLSGGEAQRVSLARAFAIQPDLLLLDEPFSALDAPTRQSLRQDLRDVLTATALTSIFITHDLDEALLLGDRVAVLLAGRLRQVGPPAEVFASPADADVAAFVGVETIVSGQVVQCQDGQVIVEANGLRLEAVGDLPPGRPVLFCLRPEDITLWPAEEAPPSSARNRIPGRIVRLAPQGPLARLTLDCGFPLVALITRASANEMGLAEGQPVIASFKATAAHLIPR